MPFDDVHANKASCGHGDHNVQVSPLHHRLQFFFLDNFKTTYVVPIDARRLNPGIRGTSVKADLSVVFLLVSKLSFF